ncbi:hypothetical protein [Nocardia mangyaensis]|uniref:hypothetical protein n=1 Tax=Nocardia mangyaensis TaxID=2213200 RepID=UPI0026762AE9|nr:hypothetical protein [Nocardia mangyaensis]MDO3646440.1 hypothetical protein [Nocardia mangyaensis]
MNRADGTVRAYYPGDDWHVVGTDHEQAITLLHAEFDRRMTDPAYVAEHWERTQRHRDGLEVTPGFEVSEIDQGEYQRRTEALGEVRSVGDPDDQQGTA